MKNIFKYLIVACLLSTIDVMAQEVPNGGFEVWEGTVIWTLNPSDWITDNTGLTAPVFPDSSAYSGELCMTLFPDANGLGEGDAIAETTIDIEYIPEALEFYARWNYVAGQVGVTITFYNETVEVISENWSPSDFESESDWQLIQMPLPGIEPLITHCVIRCYAVVGDLATATISFDDMQFGVLNDITELSTELFSLGPNPSSNQLNLHYDHEALKGSQVSIFDIEGRLVYQNRISRSIDTSTLDNGNYIVQVLFEDRVIKKQFTVIK